MIVPCTLSHISGGLGVKRHFFQGSVPFSRKKMSRVTTVVADSFYYNTKPNLNPNCTFDV